SGTLYTGSETLVTGTYYASQTTNGCESSRTSVGVTVNATPVAPTASSNSPICSGADAIFTITGTAGNTVTYTGAASGTATIGAGGTVNVSVAAVTSNTTLNLTNVSNGTCSRALIATTTVNVYSPSVTLTGTTSILENSGGNVILTATLSTVTITNTTVTLAYSGNATNGSDYTASSTIITIAAGSTTGTVTISPIDDDIYEGSETVIADITNVTGGCASELGAQTATVTITDNDDAPDVTIGDATIVEGGILSFPVSLSNPSATTITLTLGFTNVTTSNGDYTTTPVVVTFLAGATTATATVQTTEDTIAESTETFTVGITSSTGTVGSTTATATGTITDNDDAPDVTIGDATIAEGGILSFPVSLSNPSATTITLTLGLTNVTTSNGDYTTAPVVVTFLAGATTATATVQTTEDTIAESTETFTVGITSSTGTVGSTTATATGTIIDNNTAPTVTGITPSIATEGDAVVFDFELSNPSAVDVEYTFTLSTGTAGSSDYTTTDVKVTVLAGATTGTVSVPTTIDTIDESDETFTIHNGAVSATGTIIDNNTAPTVTGITPSIATEGDAVVFDFELSNPSAVDVEYTFTLSTGTAGSSDYTT
ncbi:beta strand repeat-containing protein, partial [Flavobacterium frigoris]